MPHEHGVGAPRLLGEQLVEVERHPFTAQLLGDRMTDTFERVVLPPGEVHRGSITLKIA